MSADRETTEVLIKLIVRMREIATTPLNALRVMRARGFDDPKALRAWVNETEKVLQAVVVGYEAMMPLPDDDEDNQKRD